MSTVYNLEPQPTAKAVLHTTSGDLALELWAHQAPRTCRNFLQLCLDGYYDKTTFHRVVPGFIIQGGDPTGTGAGGESSYDGKPFEDEFHTRLKYNRRGLLGMANTGQRDDNGSQFFLTLGNTPELTGKNTLFGRIEGNTIFNLVKMGEADLVDMEGAERPLYPTMITSTEVLVNPFEGMEKRLRTTSLSIETSMEKKKSTKRKAGKSMLSFAGDEGEDDGLPTTKAAKFNSKLVSNARRAEQIAKQPAARFAKRIGSPSSSLPPPTPPPPAPQAHKQANGPPSTRAGRAAPPSTSPEPITSAGQAQLDIVNAEIAALRSSLRRTVPPPVPVPSHTKSILKAMIPTTAIRGRRRKAGGADDQDTLRAFNAFKLKLDTVTSRMPNNTATVDREATPAEGVSVVSASAAANSAAALIDEEAALCDLHFIANCQSCTRWATEGEDGEADDGDNKDWMTHSLTFAKDRLGKALAFKRAAVEDLVVIDPREKARELGVKDKNDRHRTNKGAGRWKDMKTK